jgi:hypothetical protein
VLQPETKLRIARIMKGLANNDRDAACNAYAPFVSVHEMCLCVHRVLTCAMVQDD